MRWKARRVYAAGLIVVLAGGTLAYRGLTGSASSPSPSPRCASAASTPALAAPRPGGALGRLRWSAKSPKVSYELAIADGAVLAGGAQVSGLDGPDGPGPTVDAFFLTCAWNLGGGLPLWSIRAMPWVAGTGGQLLRRGKLGRGAWQTVDPRTGRTLWRGPPRADIDSSTSVPLGDGSSVGGPDTGRLVRYRPRDNRLLWSAPNHSDPEPDSDPDTAPVVGENRVMDGGSPTTSPWDPGETWETRQENARAGLSCLRLSDGRRLWRIRDRTGNTAWSPLGVRNGAVLVAVSHHAKRDSSYWFESRDLADGHVRWTLPVRADTRGDELPDVKVAGSVLVEKQGRTLTARRLSDGTRAWRVTAPDGLFLDGVATDRFLYMPDGNFLSMPTTSTGETAFIALDLAHGTLSYPLGLHAVDDLLLSGHTLVTQSKGPTGGEIRVYDVP